MPAAKRSRNSRTKISNKRSKSLKADSDSAVTSNKQFVSDDENLEQVAKRTKTNQTSANSKRWTPYFNSRKLHNGSEGPQLAAPGDGQAGDSKGLETAAMQVSLQLLNDFHTFWKMVRRALGPNTYSGMPIHPQRPLRGPRTQWETTEPRKVPRRIRHRCRRLHDDAVVLPAAEGTAQIPKWRSGHRRGYKGGD